MILVEFSLFLDALLVALGKADELLHSVDVVLAFLVEVLHLQGFGPDVLVQVHQHVLLQSGLAVVDGDAVVVSVQSVDKSLNGGLVEMAQVRGCLPGLLAHDDGLGLDKTESIDDDLTLDGLDGIDDDGDGTGRQLLERLLSVDIDGREPAAKTGVRVIPANNGFRSI